VVWPAGTEVGAGWVRVVVPVEIALRESGAPAGAGPGPGVASGLPAGLERNDPPDPDYSNRLGYDRGFLAKPVPLPSLPKTLKTQAAQPTGNAAGDLELRFLHFSTVQHAIRRLPFFTAVNIDGALSRGIDRTTGAIGEIEGLEGGKEKWFEDPRVPGSQLVQDFYDNQPHEPHWIFDRGHMVRRLDPAWGSKDTAKRASDDTFHFTNCCPQVWQFNEQAKYWAGIEDYALDNAKLTDERITVFSGPVFAASDPTLLGVSIPKTFWKIVVRVESGALRATGFLASQEQLLTDALGAPEAFTGWPDLGRAKVYQKRISDIAKATGLRFGPLKAADTVVAPPVGGPEALARPIRGLDEVQW
jgi:endonuclease G